MEISSGCGTAKAAADVARLSSAEHLERSADRRPAAEVAQSFESLFASLLVKEMRRALPEGFFGSGTDGDVYAGWFDETIGEAIAKSGALQLSHTVRASLEGSRATEDSSADEVRTP